MKQIVCVVLCIGLFLKGICQQASIYLSTAVTTCVVFESEVRHVDIGNRNILVQQVSESNKVLLLKAAQKDFSATNLSVITADGNVYVFKLEFIANPDQWVYKISTPGKSSIQAYAESILGNDGCEHGTRSVRFEMRGFLKRVYIKDGTLFFHLQIENESSLDCDLESIRFSIRDQKKPKRTASQEKEIFPLLVAGGSSVVPATGMTEIVFAFQKFTIPDAKYLQIQIAEKNGGRNLTLKIRNRSIFKAHTLSDLK